MSSFKEAFAKARKEGKKEFTWNGGKYHTRTKEEEGEKGDSSKRPKARSETTPAKSSRPKARPEPTVPKAPERNRKSDEGLTIPRAEDAPKAEKKNKPSPRRSGASSNSGEASASTTANSGRAPKGKQISFLRHVIEEGTPRRNSGRGRK